MKKQAGYKVKVIAEDLLGFRGCKVVKKVIGRTAWITGALQKVEEGSKTRYQLTVLGHTPDETFLTVNEALIYVKGYLACMERPCMHNAEI